MRGISRHTTMPAISKTEIQCTHCKAWSRSPIQFGSTEAFESSTLIGNRFGCGVCGKMAMCNKENVRYSREDGKGGFVGVDTKS